MNTEQVTSASDYRVCSIKELLVQLCQSSTLEINGYGITWITNYLGMKLLKVYDLSKNHITISFTSLYVPFLV